MFVLFFLLSFKTYTFATTALSILFVKILGETPQDFRFHLTIEAVNLLAMEGGL